jgi:anaerobic selenocysteine-containing dehydrogenase
MPSAADRYPYPIRALFLHKGTPALSIPGAQTVIDGLTHLEAIPLFFACDIVIGDTSVYADYIFPDTAIWERWGTPHQTPVVPVAGSKVRQPTVEPVTEKVRVFGEEMPLSMEAVMLAIAEKLSLPGYGKDGFAPGQDFTRPEDFYLKLVANVAAGDGPGEAVPDADSTETDLFLAARRHLSRAVFDPERFQRAVTDLSGTNWWPKVVYVLNRGGRFEDLERYDQAGETNCPIPSRGPSACTWNRWPRRDTVTAASAFPDSGSTSPCGLTTAAWWTTASTLSS